MRRAPLCTPTAWCCWIIWMIVVLGQSKFVDSKPTERSVNFEVCYNISKRLVNVARDSLTQLQNLTKDFTCSYTSMGLHHKYAHNETNTLSACLPQTCICSNINKLVINKDQCLMAIHSDLKSFSAHLTFPNLKEVTEEMMDAIKWYNDGKGEKEELCSKFNCKLRQCSAMLRLQQRAITISRIFSYLRDETSKHRNH